MSTHKKLAWSRRDDNFAARLRIGEYELCIYPDDDVYKKRS
jgi:hypothetical protein